LGIEKYPERRIDDYQFVESPLPNDYFYSGDLWALFTELSIICIKIDEDCIKQLKESKQYKILIMPKNENKEIKVKLQIEIQKLENKDDEFALIFTRLSGCTIKYHQMVQEINEKLIKACE